MNAVMCTCLQKGVDKFAFPDILLLAYSKTVQIATVFQVVARFTPVPSWLGQRCFFPYKKV